jgi:hypothetical protein
MPDGAPHADRPGMRDKNPAASPAPTHQNQHDPFHSETAHARSGTYNVSETLFHDHGHFEGMLDEVMALVDRGDLRGGALVFERFRRQLMRHVRWEDEAVYPRYLEHTHDDATLAELRRQHTEILAAVAVIGDALSRGDTRHVRKGNDDLRGVLRPHHLLEEHALYPWARQSLSLEDQIGLVISHEDA